MSQVFSVFHLDQKLTLEHFQLDFCKKKITFLCYKTTYSEKFF